MSILTASISVSFDGGHLLVWSADGITSCDSQADALDILTALGIATPEANEAIDEAIIAARHMAAA